MKSVTTHAHRWVLKAVDAVTLKTMFKRLDQYLEKNVTSVTKSPFRTSLVAELDVLFEFK